MLSSLWFWPVFSRITEYRDIRKQFHWPENIQTIVLQVTRSFLQQLSDRWKQKISKKVTFPVKKNTFTFFFVVPSFADVHNNNITGHKSIQAKLVQLKMSILKDLISCRKQDVLKKRQKGKHSNEKNSFLLFALPKITNLKKNCLRVHEVFRHLLYN